MGFFQNLGNALGSVGTWVGNVAQDVISAPVGFVGNVINTVGGAAANVAGQVVNSTGLDVNQAAGSLFGGGVLGALGGTVNANGPNPTDPGLGPKSTPPQGKIPSYAYWLVGLLLATLVTLAIVLNRPKRATKKRL